MSELQQTRKLEQPKVETQRIATEKITGEQRRQQQTNQSEVQAAKPVGEGVVPQQRAGANSATREMNRNEAASAARVSASDHNNRPPEGVASEANPKHTAAEGRASRGSAPEGTATAAKTKEGTGTPKEGNCAPKDSPNSTKEGTGTPKETNRNEAANAARVSSSDHNNPPREGMTSEGKGSKDTTAEAKGTKDSATEGKTAKESPTDSKSSKDTATESPAARELTHAEAADAARVSTSDHNNRLRKGLTSEAVTKLAVAEGAAKRGSAAEGTTAQGAPKEDGGPTSPVGESQPSGSSATESSPAKTKEGTQTEKGAFGELRNTIENHNWVKELDGKIQIFYGGAYTDGKGEITEPAWKRADREKLKHGKLVTINDTKYGKEIAANKESLTEAQSKELWSIASRKYAEAADANFSKGITPVGYVQWAGLEKDHHTPKGSDFEQVEWPRLRGLMTDEPVQGAKFEMWPNYYPKDKDGRPLSQ